MLSPGVPQIVKCLLDRLLSDRFTHSLANNLSIRLMLLPTLPLLLSSNKDHTLYSSNKGVLFKCVPQFVNPMSFAPSLASRLPQHSAFNPPTLISSFHTPPVYSSYKGVLSRCVPQFVNPMSHWHLGYLNTPHSTLQLPYSTCIF